MNFIKSVMLNVISIVSTPILSFLLLGISISLIVLLVYFLIKH